MEVNLRTKTPQGVFEIVSIKPGEQWVSITSGISGYFAVIYWLNDETPGDYFPEPWNTGIGRYRTKEEAYHEAEMIAFSEEIPLEHISGLGI